jgi:hypothetical protein
VVIVETAGEAHNDAVMILGVLLTVWALRHRWLVIATLALTAAVLTKFIPLLFGLPCLAYAYRAGLLTRRATALSLVAAVALVLAAWAPFWVGAATLGAIREGAYPSVVASTSGVIVSLIPDSVWLFRLLRVSLAAATIAIVMLMTVTRARSVDDLLRACATIALGFLFVSAPLFWAWYFLLPIAFLAPTRSTALLVLVTACSRLVAPLDLLRVHHVIPWIAEVWLTTVVALWVPLLFAIGQYVARGDLRAAAEQVRHELATRLLASPRVSA